MMSKSNPSAASSTTRAAAPALLADAMLGRLAKWLRLLGYDTLYAGRRSDHQIAALARAEERIVLTRDREFTKRRGIRCLYVESQVLEAQLVQVITDLNLAADGASECRTTECGAPATGVPEHGGERMRATRCPICNEPLLRVAREEVRPHVPAYVWKTQSLFHRCPACDKVYWPGTHWDHIQATITRVGLQRVVGQRTTGQRAEDHCTKNQHA